MDLFRFICNLLALHQFLIFFQFSIASLFKRRKRRVTYNHYLNCRGDTGARVPPLRIRVSPSRFERWMMKRSRASQHEWILQIPAKCSPILRWRPFFFGLHSIAGTELRNSHWSLVKLAKASPHAKFYNLSIAYNQANIISEKAWVTWCEIKKIVCIKEKKERPQNRARNRRAPTARSKKYLCWLVWR